MEEKAIGNVLCLRSAPAAAESKMGSDATRDLREAQLSDPGTALVLQAKERDCKPPLDLTKSQSLHGGSQVATKVGSTGSPWECIGRKFKKEDKGVIYQWIVPPGQRKEILHQLHGRPMGAHLGEAKTLGKLFESASTGLDMWRVSRSGVAHVNFVSKERIQLQKTRHHW